VVNLGVVERTIIELLFKRYDVWDSAGFKVLSMSQLRVGKQLVSQPTW
jgi:hypothetical protein